jgi:uncharacterized membrane protein YcaP (DUF421 family)
VTFIGDPTGLLRIVVMGACAYLGLLVVLRTSGKRTLAKMNAFDLVVTVALGSTLATALLSSSVSLAQALLAFAVLAGLQFAIATTSVRFALVRRLVKSEPRLLFHRGRFLDDALVAERVTPSEVRQAVRAQGVGRLEDVAAVILETDGSFSVLTDTHVGDPVLADVAGVDHAT